MTGFSIKSFTYKDKVLLAFSKQEFLELFDADKVVFEATIIDNKIVLTSPRIKELDLPATQPPQQMKVSANV